MPDEGRRKARLRGQQEQTLAALLEGATATAAAETAGVSRQTLSGCVGSIRTQPSSPDCMTTPTGVRVSPLPIASCGPSTGPGPGSNRASPLRSRCVGRASARSANPRASPTCSTA